MFHNVFALNKCLPDIWKDFLKISKIIWKGFKVAAAAAAADAAAAAAAFAVHAASLPGLFLPRHLLIALERSLRDLFAWLVL